MRERFVQLIVESMMGDGTAYNEEEERRNLVPSRDHLPEEHERLSVENNQASQTAIWQTGPEPSGLRLEYRLLFARRKTPRRTRDR